MLTVAPLSLRRHQAPKLGNLLLGGRGRAVASPSWKEVPPSGSLLELGAPGAPAPALGYTRFGVAPRNWLQPRKEPP